MPVLMTVVIPTHNPRPQNMARVLEALASQTLSADAWELLVVDNASAVPVQLPDAWAGCGRVIREERLGLTQARLCGIREARGALLVWVDDDNVLELDYLEQAQSAFDARPDLGAAGGRSLPEYEVPPPAWFRPDLAPLGCRDLGDETVLMSWQAARPDYPSAAPIGAGLVARKQAMQLWADAVQHDARRMSLGRQGTKLTSGEDNDISMTILRAGWQLAYLPGLRLIHIIAAGRLQPDYLARIARVSFRDFICVLDIHGVRRWHAIPGWTIPLRALRAYFTFKAWQGPAAYICWQSAVGQFEGRALLSKKTFIK